MPIRWLCVAVVGVALVGSGCGSASDDGASAANTDSTEVQARVGDALTFREVLGEYPYGDGVAGPCGTKQLPLTPIAEQKADAPIVVLDRKQTTCFSLGPTLLTGHDANRADVVYDSSMTDWAVNVRFGTDAFLDFAKTQIGKEFAILVSGNLEAAPTVNPGISGRAIEIVGDYDRATAIAVAAKIDPSSASRPPPPTPTTTKADTFADRCDAAAPPLGPQGPLMYGFSEITAERARAALGRAHRTVPAWLADLDGAETIALCQFTPYPPDDTPTTVCPNGESADVGEPPDPEIYAVDAQLHKIRLPGQDIEYPPGVPTTPDTDPDPCEGLGGPG